MGCIGLLRGRPEKNKTRNATALLRVYPETLELIKSKQRNCQSLATTLDKLLKEKT
jgi:hypothetical protein